MLEVNPVVASGKFQPVVVTMLCGLATENFFRQGQQWFSVAVQFDREFHAQAPQKLFEGLYLNIPGVSYDVAADGKRFIMLEENNKQPPTTLLNVVTNWFETLKQPVSH